MDKTPQQILTHYLNRKKSKNHGYSLRALARDIGKSPGFLSQVISGKRRLTPDVFKLLVEALEIDKMARKNLSLSLVFNSGLPKEAKEDFDRVLKTKVAHKEYSRFQESNIPDFDILRSWYKIALLDLTTLKTFESTIDWIAKKLKISKYQTQMAIDELLKAGLLVEKNGRLKKTKHKLRFSAMSSKESVRQYHRQMIEKAKEELTSKTNQKSFDRRLITGITIATNMKNIERAKARINEMMFEISEILTEGDCTEIFQLNAQLFGLTESEERNELE